MVCGACGEDHITSGCNNPDKHFCIACKADTHASWDRRCPEFIRRCDIYNDRFPENKLPFFSTDEDWMLTLCPDRIPSDCRFPQCFTVNSLPTHADGRRAQQQSQPPKGSKHLGKQPAPARRDIQGDDNNTIERYLVRSQTTADTSSNAREEGELPGASSLEESAVNNEDHLVDELLGSTIPGNASEWN